MSESQARKKWSSNPSDNDENNWFTVNAYKNVPISPADRGVFQPKGTFVFALNEGYDDVTGAFPINDIPQMNSYFHEGYITDPDLRQQTNIRRKRKVKTKDNELDNSLPVYMYDVMRGSNYHPLGIIWDDRNHAGGMVIQDEDTTTESDYINRNSSQSILTAGVGQMYNMFGSGLKIGDQLYTVFKEIDYTARPFYNYTNGEVIAKDSIQRIRDTVMQVICTSDSKSSIVNNNTAWYYDPSLKERDRNNYIRYLGEPTPEPNFHDLDYISKSAKIESFFQIPEIDDETGLIKFRSIDGDLENMPDTVVDLYMTGLASRIGAVRFTPKNNYVSPESIHMAHVSRPHMRQLPKIDIILLC